MKPQRRILIIDDSAEDREAFRRFLQRDTEYQNLVEEATQGEAGIAACERSSFDAVLLDHHMPRRNGLEVIRAVRALPGWSTPVLALTSTGRSDVARLMLEAGATDFLFKDDITASSLSRAITNAITKERLLRRVEVAAWRTARLQQVTAELSSARMPRQVIDVFLKHVMEALGASGSFVALLSADGTALEVDASPGFQEEEIRDWRRIPLGASLPITDAARTGALIAYNGREELSSRYPGLTAVWARSPALAAVPLRVGDTRLGAIVICFSEPHTFDEEEKAFLLLLTRQCAQALERAQLYMEERRAEAERARLYAALQESEAQRRLALEAGGLGTWRWEVASGRVDMDEVGRALLALPREGALHVRMLGEHVHPQDLARTREFLERAMQPGSQTEYEMEYRVLPHEGEPRWVVSRGRVVRDAGGNVERVVGVCYDITERKSFEIGLVRQREVEKQRADFEQQLVGIVSHDLKNPLAAILMQTAVATRQGGLDERTLRMMTRIHSSAERASRMVSDLLDFTQARLAGRIPVQVRELDARDVVIPVLEEVRLAFPNRRLSFEFSGDTTGLWDGDRLAQVVTNLVQNAVKYSPESTGIEVGLHGHGEELELFVHNAGAPIPADRLPHLFEPLQRATSQVDNASRSVGLGLYIVKHIVEAHHGTLSVDSREGEGTRFTVRLPRHGKRARP